MPTNPRQNTLITLYVNTRPVNGAGQRIPLTNSNIKDYVIIADTSGDIANDTGENVVNYESQVKSGGKVTWVGGVSNHDSGSRDFVIIRDVSVDPGNSGISTPASLPNPGPGTYAQANVTGSSGKDLRYTINFDINWINADGSTPPTGSFSIDPILKIH